MKVVKFTNAQYLGGLPDTKPTAAARTIFVSDEGIGIGVFGPKNVIPWDTMSGVSFDTGTAKKSRAGKALAFGVFALAAAKTQNEAHLTVNLKDGNTALYRIVGKNGVQIRGKVQSFLVAADVPCLDDASAPEVATSVADELTKLAQLRDSGALTEDEFTARKTKLLAD